jgi:hypothetical protein
MSIRRARTYCHHQPYFVSRVRWILPLYETNKCAFGTLSSIVLSNNGIINNDTSVNNKKLLRDGNRSSIESLVSEKHFKLPCLAHGTKGNGWFFEENLSAVPFSPFYPPKSYGSA